MYRQHYKIFIGIHITAEEGCSLACSRTVRFPMQEVPGNCSLVVFDTDCSPGGADLDTFQVLEDDNICLAVGRGMGLVLGVPSCRAEESYLPACLPRTRQG